MSLKERFAAMAFRIANKYLAFVVLICLPFVCWANGLRFHGLESHIDDRTSLVLFPERPPIMRDSLIVGFSAKILPVSKYGYIAQVEMKSPGTETVVNLLYDNESIRDRALFSAIWEGREIIAAVEIPRAELGNEWFDLSLKFDFCADSLYLRVKDGQYRASGGMNFNDAIKTNVVFGANKSQIDIPSFCLKDVTARDSHKRFHFKLNEDSGRFAACKGRVRFARVENPDWINGDRDRWRQFYAHSSDHYQSVGYDTASCCLYDFFADSLIYISPEDGLLQIKKTKTPNPVPSFLGYNHLVPTEGNIVSYEFYAPKEAGRFVSVAALDTGTLEWRPLYEAANRTPRMRHASVFDPVSGRILCHGGYGLWIFNEEFLAFDIEKKQWDTIPAPPGDAIWPRFQHAMGIYDNHLYIFGGVGSPNSSQALGQHLYTLHEIDLETKESRLLWTAPWEGGDKVPSRNLVFDDEGGFYTLMYNESATVSSLMLYRFDLKKGTYETYADPFPIYSDRITCQPNLFLDRKKNLLIATVEESGDDVSSRLAAYSISYPVMKGRMSTVERRALFGILSLLLLISGAVGVSFFSTKKRRTKRSEEIPDQQAIRPSSVYLFGDFTAFGAKGENITPSFYAKTRQVLCLLLKEPGGVSSQKLTALFWSNREDSKAKNIRGVTMNALRKALMDIDGISVVYSGERYRLELHPEFYCDYLALEECLSSPEPDMNRVISILSRGKFLQSESDPVLDNMKAEVDATIETVISKEIVTRYRNKQYKDCLKCVEILYYIDPLSEISLKYAVKSFAAMGKNEEAERRYVEFRKKYRKDYSEEYQAELDQIRAE